jgi:hypothetical protein
MERHSPTGTGSPDDLDLTFTVNIFMQKVFGGFIPCGPLKQGFTYTGGTTLRAYDDEGHGKQIDLSLADPTP